jgi:hypothetical protein
LCDDAREVIQRVADDLGVTWEERDITQSPDDMREYWEKIPVTLVDGVHHDFWRVSEDRLRAALLGTKRTRLVTFPHCLNRGLRETAGNQRVSDRAVSGKRWSIGGASVARIPTCAV